MRFWSIFAILMLLFAMQPVTGSTQSIVISEILPAPTEGREFVELYNPGATINITGWQISDTAGNTYTFAGTIAPGAHLVLWGGGASDNYGPAWSKSSVWNNGGDVVTLRDAAGTLVDEIAYGSGATTVGQHVGTPAAGQSMQLLDGAWVEADATPGQAAGASGGAASASVANVAPQIIPENYPSWGQPGLNISFPVNFNDDNGMDDIAAWTIVSEGVEIANGTGVETVALTPPNKVGPWQLELTVTDQGGLSDTVQHNVDVALSPIKLFLPQNGSVEFAALIPGATNVSATAPITVENLAPFAVSPFFDLSDFTGPAAIPVAGNVQIGISTVGGNITQYVAYDGPLTLLPELSSGSSYELHLVISSVPLPLPAGQYGTTFTVVA